MPNRGDLLLYKGKGFVSRMVKRVTKSPWSHVAWVISPTEVLESDWTFFGERGVHVNELEKYPKDRIAFVRPFLPEESIEAALEIARSKIGQRYDFSLIFTLFRKWLGSFMPWAGRVNRRNQRNGWICSELVATPLFLACGFRFVDDVPVEEIDPGDIMTATLDGRVKVRI